MNSLVLEQLVALFIMGAMIAVILRNLNKKNR